MKQRKPSDPKPDAPEKPETLSEDQLDEVAGGATRIWGDPHVAEKDLKQRVSPDLETGYRVEDVDGIRVGSINGIRKP